MFFLGFWALLEGLLGFWLFRAWRFLAAQNWPWRGSCKAVMRTWPGEVEWGEGGGAVAPHGGRPEKSSCILGAQRCPISWGFFRFVGDLRIFYLVCLNLGQMEPL